MGIMNAPFTLFQDRGIESRMRSLRYDMNAMASFEQETGMGLARLLETRAVFAATRALLWAGLRHGDRGLTVDRVGHLMQQFIDAGGGINELLERCVRVAVEQKAIPGRDELADSEKTEKEESDPNSQRSPSPSGGITTDPGQVSSDS